MSSTEIPRFVRLAVLTLACGVTAAGCDGPDDPGVATMGGTDTDPDLPDDPDPDPEPDPMPTPAPDPEPTPDPPPEPTPDPPPEPTPDPEPDCSPAPVEQCNGLDDTCEGEVDEGCPVPGTSYRLTNGYLGTAYSLEAWTTDSGVYMAQTADIGSQAWTILPIDGTHYRLSNEWMGPVLSLDSWLDAPFIAPTGDYSGQAWTLTHEANGCWRLRNAYAGEGVSLDSVPETTDLFMGLTTPFPGQCWAITPLD